MKKEKQHKMLSAMQAKLKDEIDKIDEKVEELTNDKDTDQVDFDSSDILDIALKERQTEDTLNLNDEELLDEIDTRYYLDFSLFSNSRRVRGAYDPHTGKLTPKVIEELTKLLVRSPSSQIKKRPRDVR